ncbi:phosphopantetheine-binding protein [Streptomyces sp. bgisy082]|uniref:phosphopantetheine-binding protein n=1 Tax=Streptomyces sp. bgisy082 TaxID=3413776 RepID=UPI003D735B99
MESATQVVHPTGGRDETSERAAGAGARATAPGAGAASGTAPGAASSTAPDAAPGTAPDASGSRAREVAALWAEVLGVPEVGVEDDFFALGGNSLSGIKIIERVAQDHGVQLSVRDFYLAQTPARVAELIERGRAEA